MAVPELHEIDVSVLRLRPGDVVVAQIAKEIMETDGGLDYARGIADALKAAVEAAGHTRVSIVITGNGEISWEILRPEGTP